MASYARRQAARLRNDFLINIQTAENLHQQARSLIMESQEIREICGNITATLHAEAGWPPIKHP